MRQLLSMVGWLGVLLLWTFSPAHAQVQLQLPDETLVDAGAEYSIPISLSNVSSASPILAGSWQVTGANRVYELIGIDATGTLLEAAEIQFTAANSRIAFATGTAITTGGTLLKLRIRVKAEAARFASDPIRLSELVLNEGEPAFEVTNGTVRVRAISISPSTANRRVVVGESLQLSATGNVVGAINWASSNSAIATVSGTGLLRGVAPGLVQITATDAATGLSATSSAIRIVPETFNSLTLAVTDARITQTLTQELQLTTTSLTGLAIQSGQVNFSLPSAQLELLDINTTGGLLDEATVSTQIFQDGPTYRLAFAATEPLSGQGALLNLRVRVKRNATGRATINLSSALLNESIEPAVDPGQIDIDLAPIVQTDPAGLVEITQGNTRSFSVTGGGTAPYSWSSANSGIARIDAASGQLQAVARGLVDITATDTEGFTSVPIQLQVNDFDAQLPDTVLAPGGSLDVPIRVGNTTGLGIFAFEADIAYDTTVVRFDRLVLSGSLAEGYAGGVKDTAGVVNIAVAGTQSLAGAGVLAYLRFRPAEASNLGDQSPLELRRIIFNEPGPNTPTATRISGSIRISNDAPPPPSNTQSFTLALNSGWNLVGLPGSLADRSVQSLFPNALPSTLFGFVGRYTQQDSLVLGQGYWIRYGQTQNRSLEVTPTNALSVELALGWNLITAPSAPMAVTDIQDPQSILIESTTFGFEGRYVAADSLKPGRGYWIRASAAGSVQLGATSAAKVAHQSTSNTTSASNQELLQPFHRIQLLRGQEEAMPLYFGGRQEDPALKAMASLPPLPPAGVFDARLAGDLRISPEEQTELLLQAVNQPVELQIYAPEGHQEPQYYLKIWVESQGCIVQSVRSRQATTLPIGTQKVAIQLMKPSESTLASLPTDFTLEPAYPNPFNPTTTIGFALPEASQVRLEVFNIQGQRVATLVNERMEAGQYNQVFDASNLPSGLYLYRIQAGSFTQTKKLVLMK